MADLSFGGTGGTGGGITLDSSSFGGTSNWGDTYTSGAGSQQLDTNTFSNEYFSENFQAKNPYNKTYSVTTYVRLWVPDGWDQYGNPLGHYQTFPMTATYANPAYGQYESGATSAQNIYLSQQQAIFDKANDKATSDLTASYGNVRDTTLQNSIQQLADIKEQITSLKFQDDITDYLNRVGDTDNSKLIAELEQQAAILDADLSKKLLEYWQQQELIRKASRKDWTFGDPQWLTDPYFGRGGGEIYPRFIGDSAQQDTKNFFDLNSNGEMSDWMAGGSMYDSPRAGDILFNAMGNLNTTVFLGLENKNFAFDMTASYANAEVFKTFGALAGDDRFSVLNFGGNI